MLGEGNNRKNKFTPDVVEFDPTSIPTRKWAQYNPDRRESLDSRRNDFASDGKSPVFDSRESVTSGATNDVMSLKSSGTAYSTPQKGRSMSPGIAAPPLSPFRGLVDSRITPSPGGYTSSRATASLYKEYMTPTRGESVYREYSQMQNMVASPTASSQRGAQSVASNSQYGGVQTPSGISQPVYPADDALLYQIRLLVSRSDLMTMTKRQVREELSTIFGIDMTPKKSTINYFLEEVLKGTL